MKKFSPILNGFKGSNMQEVQKGILNPSKLDNTKYAIFSNGQIQEYLKSVITKNEGMALEIQKSVVANVKEEMSHLIPVNIMHNGKVKKFYVAKADSCVELVKAMEPVNKKEGYFDSKINEDDILKFIDENEEVDDDMLIKEFGEDVTEVLNTLEEDGKLDVNEDGFYFVTDETEGEGASEGEGAGEGEGEGAGEGESAGESEGAGEAGEGEGAGIGEGEGAEAGKGEDEGEGQQGGEGESAGAAGGGTQEINFDGEGEGAGDGEGVGEGAEGAGEGEGLGEGAGEGEGEGLGEREGAGEGAGENMGEGEGEGLGEGEDMGEGAEKGEDVGAGAGEGAGAEMTPEELEAFAKKTATVTLLKFYKNSTDEKLKEIAAIELKSRGVDVENGGATDTNNQNGELPENKAALDALENFTKDYLGKYDNEDLISVVVELANQDPGKRKELKDLYRKYYSMNNDGNKLLKVDEDEFKEFLTDKYFNNFTNGDLQSYAYLLISKNPKEYRKYKKMMDLANEPIV